MADKPRTFSKAIRAYCLDCCGGSANEVKLCPAKECPLWDFRFGKNPNKQKRELTEEQRQVLTERLKKMHEARKEVQNGNT